MKSKTMQKTAAWLLQFVLLFEILAPGITTRFIPGIERPARMFYTAVVVSSLLVYAATGNMLK